MPAEGLEFRIVVHVADVGHALARRDVARDRLLIDRQLDVLERSESRLDLGDDRTLVFAEQVNRQTVGAKQVAQFLRQFENDFVDVLGRVNLVRDRLQLLLEVELFRQIVGGDRFALEYGAH